MKRREFIALLGGAAAWPLAARAQQPAMPVIGFLRSTSLAVSTPMITGFRQGLTAAGFTEGQNVAIEYRYADNQLERLPGLVAELIRLPVAVIVANNIAALSAKAATTTVPIVFATGSDPVVDGLVGSLNRPGGRLTGVTVVSASLWPKRLELLRELASPTPLVALLVNPRNPNTESTTRELQAAARVSGQNILMLNVSVESEIESMFAALVEKRAGALLLTDDPLFINRREKLVSLAARHSMPTIYGKREFVVAGGLISYGASTVDQYLQSGRYVARILKGTKPTDLPVQRATKLELVINLRTAKALGLDVPDKLLALADEVIE